jgi:hypothetical protein
MCAAQLLLDHSLDHNVMLCSRVSSLMAVQINDATTGGIHCVMVDYCFALLKALVTLMSCVPALRSCLPLQVLRCWLAGLLAASWASTRSHQRRTSSAVRCALLPLPA